MRKKYFIIFILLLIIPIKINGITLFLDDNHTENNYSIQKLNQEESTEDSSTAKNGHWEHVDENIHFCQREDTSKVVKAINLIIQIIRVAVPIILIISLAIGISKAVINPNQFNNIIKISVVKIVSAILIFLLPTIISIITNIAGFEVNYTECLEMSKNPKKVYIWVEDKPIDIYRIVQNGVYFRISARNVTGYYFSNKKVDIEHESVNWIDSNKSVVDFILLPGDHYIYIRTLNGFHEDYYNVKNEDIVVTNDVKDIDFLTTDIDEYLKDNYSSIDELNESIARSVYIAGGSTKKGAAAAALALTQILYLKYKIKIPYGSALSSHVEIGVPTTWGSSSVTQRQKDGNFKYQGIHCGGFVSWSYAQANFEMNSGIGSSAQICRWRYGTINDIEARQRGEVGDVLTYAVDCDQSSHVSIIVAMDDKGYYVTEANAITGGNNGLQILRENIGIVTTYNKFGTRWRSYLDMTLTLRYRKKSTTLKSGF